VYDALDLEGRPLGPSFRAWPQTEALKAHLAAFEHDGTDTRAAIARDLGRLLDHYLAVEPEGGWQDRFGPAWAPMAAVIPASTLYHLTLAFAELLRLEPRLSPPPGPG
jgi:N-acylglucosamine 2-epimerase/mannose-6-phosphate isomerase